MSSIRGVRRYIESRVLRQKANSLEGHSPPDAYETIKVYGTKNHWKSVSICPLSSSQTTSLPEMESKLVSEYSLHVVRKVAFLGFHVAANPSLLVIHLNNFSLAWPDSLCTGAYRLKIISAALRDNLYLISARAERVWPHKTTSESLIIMAGI